MMVTLYLLAAIAYIPRRCMSRTKNTCSQTRSQNLISGLLEIPVTDQNILVSGAKTLETCMLLAQTDFGST